MGPSFWKLCTDFTAAFLKSRTLQVRKPCFYEEILIPPYIHLSLPLISRILSSHLNVYPCLLSAEDPSENYVKLRDFVLSKLCQSLPAFTVDKLPLGFSDEMVKEAQDKLKINKVWYRSAADYHLSFDALRSGFTTILYFLS